MFVELMVTPGGRMIVRRKDISTVKIFADYIQVEIVDRARKSAYYMVKEPYDVFKKRLGMAYGWDWDHPEFLEG